MYRLCLLEHGTACYADSKLPIARDVTFDQRIEDIGYRI